MSKTNKNNGCIEIPERLVDLFPCRECQGESQEEDVVSEVADDIAEMGVLLKEFSSLLAAVAVHVGNVADCLIETFADECFSEDEDEEALDHDVLVINPNGEQHITDVRQCMQDFPWFKKVSVFEPVPGRDDLFITCDVSSIVTTGFEKYLTGPAVIIRMEENPEKEGSITTEDAIYVMRALAERHGLLVSDSSGKKIRVICIS